MGGILNTLLKTPDLMQCPCTPGIVAAALEQLSGPIPPDFTLDTQTTFDPVLTVRLRRFQMAADASATLADPTPLLRALLLSAPVAEGAQLGLYVECWLRSLKVASLTRALAKRSGLVTLETAWLAGLTHNLADYAQLPYQTGASMEEAQRAEISAAWTQDLDEEGWIADAVRYHALPLTRTNAGHPLSSLPHPAPGSTLLIFLRAAPLPAKRRFDTATAHNRRDCG